MDIKKPLFITILIVAFCIAGIIYIRMTKEPESVKTPVAAATVKKSDKTKAEKKKVNFIAVETKTQEKPDLTQTNVVAQYKLPDFNFDTTPYKTVCLGYEGDNCNLKAELYAEKNANAVLYRVCGNAENIQSQNCSKNIIAVYNAKNEIENLYICDAAAPFGQCGALKERKHYSYDKLGNVYAEEIFAGQSGRLNSLHNFTYDSAGKQIYSKECLSFENNTCNRWGLPVPAFDYPPYIFNSFYKPYFKKDMRFNLINEKETKFIFDKRDNFIASFIKNYEGDLKSVTYNSGDNIVEKYCISKEGEKCIISGDLVLNKMGQAVSYRICRYIQEDVCSVEREKKFFYDNKGRPVLVFDCAQGESFDFCKTGMGISFFYRDNSYGAEGYTITKQIYCSKFSPSGNCLKYETGWVKPKETWLYCYAFDSSGNCLNAQEKNKFPKPYSPHIKHIKDLVVLSVLKHAQYNADKTRAIFCKDNQYDVCEPSDEGVEFIRNRQGEEEVILKYKNEDAIKTPYAYYIDDGKGNYIDFLSPEQNR